ncbi:MAG: GNAT family N-acetyltransferase [Roseobacter sp.]
MTIRVMSHDDLCVVLNWAEKEGWNPGLDDAAAFHAADPSGFLIKTLDGQLVSAISVVNHTADFAFLGLYLCKPEFRGKGYGMDIWRAGLAHAGHRVIGLDGVPDQQENYARSGFVNCGKTVRYEGHLPCAPDPHVRCVSPQEISLLIDHDAKAAGIRRDAFARAWFAGSANRQTMVLTKGTDITGFATFRRCCIGTKIGPFKASCEADALALLSSNPFCMPSEAAYIDIPDKSASFAKLLFQNNFTPVFETARMYSGPAPKPVFATYQAIASMELG